MTRALVKLVVMAGLIVAGAFALDRYQSQSELARQLAAARAEADDLRHAVDRLTADRRVAQLLVTDQRAGPDGLVRTTLLMEEPTEGDGPQPPPLRFTLVGDEAHLDGKVISFDDGLVARGDAFRGRSLCLFTRAFGNHQPPADGTVLDDAGRLGQLDRGTDPRVTAFQRSLWAQFWRLAEDADLRKARGVRSADGQGVWFPCRPGRVYTVTLRSTGGMTVTNEPVQGLFRDALVK